MHFNIVETLVSRMKCDKAMPRISTPGRGQILLTLEPCCLLDTCMQNDDKTLLSIGLAIPGHLVKMLITLEPHSIFLKF